ncbi:HNH endonuclease [Thiofilum flexile]|uniref:HNH endonuclease n=1 Tax=Thiofilum flexile TaxID=125627 RepID=UPI00037822B4|nr:HNH endonuclease [Thiofilum flexile]
MSEYIAKALRLKVAERAKGCCEYCWSQALYATQSFSIDHIFPVSLGGITEADNLALSCQGCNSHKSNKLEAYDPITQQSTELYNPRKHLWSEHFSWSDDYLLIIGLTPVGRGAVEALHLNRAPLLNLRRVLYAMGEHPPVIS